MIRAIPILLATICASTTAEEIYRAVDEEGVPSFSDQRLPGSERVEVREPATFSDPIVKKKLRKVRMDSPSDERSIKYTLAITEPASGAAIRDNAGNLTMTASIEPSLSAGHSAELTMNGLMIRRLSNSGPISLSNVDRGTHQFSLRVVNASGDIVSEGPSTSITMLRFSKQHRTN